MKNIPPIEEPKDTRERSTGRIERLYCKKCRRNLSLRDIVIKENDINCKKCGTIILEVKCKFKERL